MEKAVEIQEIRKEWSTPELKKVDIFNLDGPGGS
jgi:hypothetical protein